MRSKPIAEQEGRSLPNARLTVSIFSSLLAIVLAGVYLTAQENPQTDLPHILSVLTLSFWLVLLPQGCRFWLSRSSSNLSTPGLGFDALVLLGNLGLLMVLGELSELLPMNLMPLFWGLGIGLFALCWGRFLIELMHQKMRWAGVFSGAIAFLFSLRQGWAVWGLVFHSPQFEEKLLAGEFHTDTLFHTTLASLIQTYGIASTGLEGVNPVQYHIGSHWVFALLAQLIHLPPLTFYHLAYPLLIIPFFFYSFLSFVLDVRSLYAPPKSSSHLLQDWRFWMLLLIGFIGFLPAPLLREMRIGLISLIASESHLLSMSFAFLLLSLANLLYQQRPHTPKTFDLSTFALAAGISLFIPLITLTKVSIGFLMFCGLGYGVLRLQLFRYRSLLPGIGLGIMVQYLAFHRMGYFGENANTETPVQLFAYFQGMEGWAIALWFPTILSWTLIYILFRLRTAPFTRSTLMQALQTGHFIDIEMLAVITILGLLPGMVLDIPGFGAYYFMDLQMWVSLSLILGYVLQFSPIKHQNLA